MYIYGGHGDSKKNKNWEAIYRFDSSFLEWYISYFILNHYKF